MPAAGIEPGQEVLSPLPSLSHLLSLPFSGYSSFDFISVSLLRSVACARLGFALPCCAFFFFLAFSLFWPAFSHSICGCRAAAKGCQSGQGVRQRW